MRFVPFEQLDSSPNIIVDGAAGIGTVLTLSHWPKSGTPKSLKRDTSAEIVFAYLDSPPLHVKADVVSNNHFDEDGLVGIFALANPFTAEKYRLLLMDTARAGDFGVYSHRDAARIAFVLSSYADPTTSPLPPKLFVMPYAKMAGQLYLQLLEVLPAPLTNLMDYKPLWEGEDEKLTVSEELIEKRQITIEERPAVDLAVVTIPQNLLAQRIYRFAQSRLEECHPMALYNHTACSRLLIIHGQHVEFHYRYESWVQFASRMLPLRVDLNDLALELNQEEASKGRWIFDGVELGIPRLHLNGSPTTSLSPIWIQRKLEHHLLTGLPAWDPYD